MHPILKYLIAHKKTQSEFARRAGISKGFLCDVISGRSFLGRANSLKVVTLSGGEITLEDLISWSPPDEKISA